MSDLFDFVSDQLEAQTELDRLQARGTLRIALKGAGLDARTLNREQLLVILDRVLPAELENRGIEGAPALCAELRNRLPAASEADGGDSPADVFARLAG